MFPYVTGEGADGVATPVIPAKSWGGGCTCKPTSACIQQWNQLALNEPLWPQAWTQLHTQTRDLSTLRDPFSPDGDAEAIMEPQKSRRQNET